MGKAMAATKARKFRFDLFGYGAIALYVAFLAVVAAGIYGFNLTGLLATLHKDELMREQLRTGRMVVPTEDSTQCRSVRFNNETAELSNETVTDCDIATGRSRGPGGSFSVFRNGFVGR
jgi:hypothetical protein